MAAGRGPWLIANSSIKNLGSIPERDGGYMGREEREGKEGRDVEGGKDGQTARNFSLLIRQDSL